MEWPDGINWAVTYGAGPPGWVLVPGSELILVLWNDARWEKEEGMEAALILLLHNVLHEALVTLRVQTLSCCHQPAAIKYVV